MNNDAIMIRIMDVTDIDRVVAIHTIGFPTSRSTRLGTPFLRKMYKWYVVYQTKLSLVAVFDNEVVGFVTGAADGDSAQRRFRYGLMQILWGFLTHPQFFFQPQMYRAWRVHLHGLYLRIIGHKRPEKQPMSENSEIKITLDSISVDPSVRGRSVGKQLMRAFETAAEQHGASYVALGVKIDNTAARGLYKSSGWQLVNEDAKTESARYHKYF